MTVAIALLALVLERLLGYPQALVDRIGHPVIWAGALIGLAERRLNDLDRPAWQRRLAGLAAMLVLLLIVGGAAAALALALRGLPLGWAAEALLASTLLASRHLGAAVAAVAEGLRRSLAEGRAAVAHIVGRDTREIDAPAVARAAIETLAENASDGVVAPLFYLALFGLPGIAVYKLINTADSMIGHRDARFGAYGWAAARIDDLVNVVPARLTALLFALAALPMRGADAGAALYAARRDARHHASPNAGWPEAALAGALGFGLGGPRSYGGAWVDLPAMGAGRRDLGPDDVDAALALYGSMTTLLLVLTAAVAALLFFSS